MVLFLLLGGAVLPLYGSLELTLLLRKGSVVNLGLRPGGLNILFHQRNSPSESIKRQLQLVGRLRDRADVAREIG